MVSPLILGIRECQFEPDYCDKKTFKWRKIDASRTYRKVINMGIDYLSGLDLSRIEVSSIRCTGIITIQGISNPKRLTSIESCLECFSFIGRIDKLAKSPDLGYGSERRCRFEAYYDHENINGRLHRGVTVTVLKTDVSGN